MIRTALRRKGWVEKKFHFLTKFVPSVDGDGEGAPGRVSACVFCVKRVCLSWRPTVCGAHAERRALRCGLPGEGLAAQPRPALVLVTSSCVPTTSGRPCAWTLPTARRWPGLEVPPGPACPLLCSLRLPLPTWSCLTPAGLLPSPRSLRPLGSRVATRPAGSCWTPLIPQFMAQVGSVDAWGAPRPKPDLAVLLMGRAPHGALPALGPVVGPAVVNDFLISCMLCLQTTNMQKAKRIKMWL